MTILTILTNFDNFQQCWQFSTILTIFNNLDNFWQFGQFSTILTIFDNVDQFLQFWPFYNFDNVDFFYNFYNWRQLTTIFTIQTIAFAILTIEKTILETCDIWDTDYNSENWEPEFMTIFLTWQLIVTLDVDSIRNSCDVYCNTTASKKTWKHVTDWNKPSQDIKSKNLATTHNCHVSNVGFHTPFSECEKCIFFIWTPIFHQVQSWDENKRRAI